MAVFCLVHGSIQNASGWDLVIPELRQRGHTAVAVDLPANRPEASGTEYARVIADALEGAEDDVFIVCHSVSGLFVPLVAELRPVRGMVFLAATIPLPGWSALDQLRTTPDMLNPAWIGKDPTKDDDVAMQFLFHDCTPDKASWALTTRRLMYARHALEEVCPLKQWPPVPSWYILCRDDRTIRPDWSRRAAQEMLGVNAIELPGGHCPHVSRPSQLAEVLHQIAESDRG